MAGFEPLEKIVGAQILERPVGVERRTRGPADRRVGRNRVRTLVREFAQCSDDRLYKKKLLLC